MQRKAVWNYIYNEIHILADEIIDEYPS